MEKGANWSRFTSIKAPVQHHILAQDTANTHRPRGLGPILCKGTKVTTLHPPLPIKPRVLLGQVSKAGGVIFLHHNRRASSQSCTE
jgi:hypothetical protein